MRKAIAGTLIALGAACSAPAQAYMNIGAGVQSCGTWTVDHEQSRFASVIDEQWVVGFLSGIGYSSASEDPFAGMNYNGVTMWISNFCAANPTLNIIAAAEAFARSRAATN